VGSAAPVEPCTLKIQEGRTFGIYPPVSTGDSDPDGSRMSVQLCCAAVGVLVVEKVAGCSIALNQQLFVGEARWCLFVELGDRDVLHELQRDTQQLVIDTQKRHGHVAECCHDRRC